MTERQEPKRNAIILDESIQRRVAELAKEHKLNQGEAIEVMMDMLQDNPEFVVAMQAKRQSKVSSRTGKTAILKKLSKLTPEQLEALAANLPQE